MKEKVILMGMVLMTSPVGDYDKRLVILTRERGKISAFARGSRKPNSPLVSCCQPFVFGEFTLYEGQNSYNVMSASVENYFTGLHTDWAKVCHASYFTEIAAYLTRENLDATELLKLLYQSLRVLERGEIPQKLVRYIYELRCLVYDGEAPQVYSCVKCGKETTERIFAAKKGGLLCEDCLKQYQERGTVEVHQLKPGTLHALQYIVTVPLKKLYTFMVTEDVLEELGEVAEEYRNIHMPHPFHSLELL